MGRTQYDPDLALRMILDLVKAIHEPPKRDGSPAKGPLLAAHVAGLHRWLRRGGRLPKAWAHSISAPLVTLTRAEAALVREALDSHMYWQLSDEEYRDSGEVLDPGSDDPENVEALKACDELDTKIAKAEAGE